MGRYSLLFVPAFKAHSIFDRYLNAKGSDAVPHAVIFDLEDSINPNFKAEARTQIKLAIDSKFHIHKNSFNWFVRINGFDSPYFMDDLNWFQKSANYEIGIMVPKFHSEEELDIVRGECGGHVPIIPLLETIAGYRNRDQLLPYAKKSGISQIAFGAGDMSLELGIEKDYNITLLKHVVSELIISCKIAGLDIIDSPSRILPKNNAGWVASLEKECNWANSNGFNGKLAIHPSQVPVIEKIFSTEKKIVWARSVIKDFSGLKNMQTVRSSESGDYMGLPVIKYAQRIIENIRKGDG